MADKTFGSSDGLTILSEDQATPANGMVAHVTSSWNSGYQNGDIKGAFLSDTDTASLVGSGELVTNGTFDAATGWSQGGIDAASNTIASGVATVAGNSYAYQAIATVAGQTYVVSATVVSTSANSDDIRSGTTIAGYELGRVANAAVGTHTFTFTATGSTSYISLKTNYNPGSTSQTTVFDNISVKLADADRSVNANGLIVNGTVTRSPVATGAELVAYSGFSSSNYLEQPYNPDLDFGTGDFCYMGWFYDSSVNGASILTRNDGVGQALNYGLGSVNIFSNAGLIKLRLGNSLVLNHAMPLGSLRWVHVVALRRSGVAELWVDGVLRASSGNSENLTLAGATLRFGQYFYSQTFSAVGGTILALWRISATAPTADQIWGIYEDEKLLFQTGAQATLYGSSDAVTALAHDQETDLLHVGTSAGRSVFKGLRRINNTTDAVTTAISAHDGLIAEQ